MYILKSVKCPFVYLSTCPLFVCKSEKLFIFCCRTEFIAISLQVETNYERLWKTILPTPLAMTG